MLLMDSFCARCGQKAELYSSPGGSMLCMGCLEATKPRCIDCIKCHQRRCGDAIYACPFCHLGTPEDAGRFVEKAKRLEPLRIEEKCGRCGGTLAGRAFILHGKALCRDCLFYEQDRWEIVPAKPGKSGTRIKIVLSRPEKPGDAGSPGVDELGKKLFGTIGLDPEKPPKDPFVRARTMDEKRMPDGSCVNCEAYAAGKKRGNFLGSQIRGESDKS
jgi:hypothetical protein